ncbi:hypothetical protein AB6864_07145 [Serratia proteamaculans]|jgi:hypothetical protein|uniref:Uncharacterized protein n=1 Tax=Serratia proteamaculans TaxID=28151 RepID=A0A7U0N468_SERPR|nr:MULTISPECIES: hypothetical protein [Serratia]MBO1503911.1 hypothetical protein [Serratia proteamaculans]MDW5510525.1 hypothetical protein [Serratia proteamaculans]QQX52184.1 hypothetical protein JKX24_18585 [Serratia proteamaculans]WEO88023.1 hypothetical protein JET59_017860 [Serratia proteamaculans]CAI1837318.1 Uncharacterised protein [Serratia proteamaculans]
MSYNQKVWLGILVLCSVFWLAVIGSVFSAHEAFERANLQSQQDFAARYVQHNHGTAAPSHALQAKSPTS